MALYPTAIVQCRSSTGNNCVYVSRDGSRSIEQHTTLSAHPFEVSLPAGKYTITALRGKEYFEASQTVTIADKDVHVELTTKRWIHMAERGWYSGDTHVHRTLADLPNLILAEDLNVALPLTHWVTDSEQTPAELAKQRGVNVPAKLIEIDKTHVIWPVNTEYEIFTVKRKRHTLGALFILNHSKPLTKPAPPVTPIVKEAKSQGRQVLLDLDKHNWPWSMMVAPVADVHLFELSNNHVWRTDFLFSTWYPEYVGKHMGISLDAKGFNERQWIEFGFQNYHTLLNCGLKIRPTAGTASGVHPVPLGFGRVYAEVADEFTYDKWIDALAKGRSFVSTGPMLTATFNGKPLGSQLTSAENAQVKIRGTATAQHPLGGVQVIVNGKPTQMLEAVNRRTASGGYESNFEANISVDETSWIALLVFEKRKDGRPRFAHTSPVHVTIADKPIRPSKAEVQYLTERIENEIQRHRGVLSAAALAEYEQALTRYKALLPDKAPQNGSR
jgi:hypothetical protein